MLDAASTSAALNLFDKKQPRLKKVEPVFVTGFGNAKESAAIAWTSVDHL